MSISGQQRATHCKVCRNSIWSGAAMRQHSSGLMAASHSPMRPSHASHGSYGVKAGMAMAKRSMKGM